jgi:hypothetical protein
MGSDGMSLVPVSGPLDPWYAERICQALESEGIAATYFGRTGTPGSGVPFSVGLGRVRIAVHDRAAQRATDLVREMVIADSPER